jgi:hypothetical protein
LSKENEYDRITASYGNQLHFLKLICNIKINHLVNGSGLQFKEDKRKRMIQNSDSLHRTLTPTYISR